MVDKMTKYSFILLDKDKEGFLEKLQSLGVVDITRSRKPLDETSTKLFDRIAELKARISRLESGSDEHMLALQSEKKNLENEARSASVWGSFDPSALKDLSDKGLKFAFYCTSERKFDPSWKERYAIQEISRQDGSVYFVVVNGEDFPLKELPAPDRSITQIESEIDSLDKEIARYGETLRERKKDIPSLQSQISVLSTELDRYLASIKGENAAGGYLCVFIGFAPTESTQALEKALEEEPVYWIKEDASAKDNPPIKLKNNAFARLFEPITGMYGMPVYDEFDPTPYLAIFFMLFFAICMGDAGYGLILILFGLAEDKGWIKVGMFKGLGKLIMVLGVATFFVGIVLGSFFGVDLVAASWVPAWLKKVMIKGTIAGYDAKMVGAVIIGVFHICLAMVIKTVGAVRRTGFKDNLSTLGWTTLIVGSVIVLALGMLKFIPEPAAKWIIICIAGISALGIFIFNKIGRNPLLNIGVGVWDTYQMATGLLGDVLSYIRLYALGLAGGMLGAAFNNLAGMLLGSNPTWQWLPFVLILLVGHILNLLMSCLGAFVHPLRLNFVEFFKNSGYEGTGLKYNPLNNKQ